MAAVETLKTKVAIVGGGPVGMGLAIELGLRGIDCVIIERHDTPQPIPKGQNLTQRSMEHFELWGIANDVRAARTIPREFGIAGLTAYGTLLGEYTYDWLQRALVRPYYFADNERLPQYATEMTMRKRAAELPNVRIRYGWSGEEIQQDAERVKVIARRGAEHIEVEADWLVGCDGSKSTIRTESGITQTLSDHDRLMCLLVFRSPELHALLERYPGKSYFCVLNPELDGYWRFFGRVDLGTTWFFHCPLSPGTTKDNFDFRKLLHTAAGATFGVEFDHIGFWELRVATADTYRKGRVFIAGDSAHSHPPYGGYGFNTGLEDIRNLGWKLAAAIEGWGGPGLLDSYGTERRPVFLSTARDFIEKSIESDRSFLRQFDPARDRVTFEREWNGRKTGAKDEVNAFEPHYEGSPLVFGPAGASCSAVGDHSFQARPGHHLAPQPLSSGRGMLGELGKGFTLLSLGGSAETVAQFRAAAERMRVPLTVISDTPEGGRERYGAGLVLVRPDHFVAWAGDTCPDPGAVMRKAIGG